MASFIEGLAQSLFAKHGSSISELCIVFPNQRSGLFFQNCLAKLAEEPIWAPTIYSMEKFVCEVSGLTRPDLLSLNFDLYETYTGLYGNQVSFDKFYHWGGMLLNDFNDVDEYGINAARLFEVLKDQKYIEATFEGLSEEEREVVRSFWKNFDSTRQSEEKENFIRLWEKLADLYTAFKEKIRSRQRGYEGMIYRDAADRIENKSAELPYKQLVFAGFNALNQCEERIFKALVSQERAEVFWDVDAYYIEDESQEAGFFFRNYLKDPVLGPTFPEVLPRQFDDKERCQVSLIGVPLEVGQAKLAGQLLARHGAEIEMQNTAMILPDESLLFPVLHSLPDAVQHVNVTMGYPLRNSPLYSFMIHVIELQLSSRETPKGIIYHYKLVQSILRHPLFFYHNVAGVTAYLEELEQSKQIWVQEGTLQSKGDLYAKLFCKINHIDDVFSYVLDLLLNLVQHMQSAEDEDAPNLEEEYIYQYFTQIKRLREVLTTRQLEINLATFWRLFRQVAEGMRLPFSGEPIRGLQLMGILESRNLDFETVFILSMNEASFPPRHQTDSFIPFNLRKGFGMPLPEHYDAMYAYYFYRLFHKSKRVFILHNTQNSSQLSGELSRLVQQLRFESGFKITEQVLSHEIRAVEPKPIIIQKNKAVQEELGRYCMGMQGKSLTPSALNMYLDCPVKFYFQQVAGLKELDEVNEEIDPSVFGNLLHRVLELLYKGLASHKKSYDVVPADFEWLRAAVDDIIVKAFKREFRTGQDDEFEFEGRNLIIRDIIKEYTDKALDWDEAYAPFTIEGLEANERQGFRMDFPVLIESSREAFVSLKGTIDRIDRKEDVVRVLDYKSGSDSLKYDTLASLFDPLSEKRNKAAMQVFFYGMLYLESDKANVFDEVHAGLVLIKRLFDPKFDYRLESTAEGKAGKINDIQPLLPDYRAHLGSMLEEIFNPKIPFEQTTDHKKCSYCAYVDICHRG